ncbi:MAG: DEAD/DEAH box helicase [Pseudomonadota bacterium]
MTHFKDLGLPEPILRAVAAQGHETPTPIQAEVIPAMLAGRDVVGIAQTGTGKTASFVLPMLTHAYLDDEKPDRKHCKYLIITPTRELATQITETIRVSRRFIAASVHTIVGGAKMGPQVKALTRGVDVIVATPGRLMDHMAQGTLFLDQVRAVVLDEADQMMDLGFLPAIQKIVKSLPPKRQMVLMSATMPPPIRALADQFLNEPQEISVAPQAQPIERIDQTVIHGPADEKRENLLRVLADKKAKSTIIFSRTKRGADRLEKFLKAAGHEAAAIHGDKAHSQRERALRKFKQGDITVLVATDIAARGIDIDGVTHVVNFELPNVPESYVHRIGRTARAGRSGVAVSLVAPEEVKHLRAIEKIIGRKINAVGDIPATIHKAKPRRKPQGKPTSFRGPKGSRPQNAGKHKGPGKGRPQRRRRTKPNSQMQTGSKPSSSKSAA